MGSVLETNSKEFRGTPKIDSNFASPGVELVGRARVRAVGKFLFSGIEKFYVRGVTYGPFLTGEADPHFHDPRTVARDFRAMRDAGINAIRTYTVPPIWLLDLATENHLSVMVGLPWEQHIAFLESRRVARDIVQRVNTAVGISRQHPAVMCYTVGNEIPAHVVRWHGPRAIERHLRRLYDAVKSKAPETLVTYANYPSTEYLDLPFFDLVTFNLYLEKLDCYEAYLARLHNLAGDRPLLIGEIGLDSKKHGPQKQAEALDWQIRASFASGCAGTFAFSWTDEWSRGGEQIDGWSFGLTDRDRRPKPALESVASAYKETPFASATSWPRVSVVICTYNGAKTLRDSLAGVSRLDYPDYETIVVDDGSTDNCAQIASEFPGVNLIRTDNRGLSSARNTGLTHATGSIIAYLDDDASPDSHWLKYLVQMFHTTNFAGIGGPNLSPDEGKTIADCVANAPGGPTHVLLTDRQAEHIPGCNMAFRKSALLAVGGFDPRFRIAGDDVDICWELQARGMTLGFCPSALVWHQRRNRLWGYWKQQLNYGRAEADLERKWPEKYNSVGHLTWAGRLYQRSLFHGKSWWSGRRIYHGMWGSALFQSVYQPAPGVLSSLPSMPEWYVVMLILAAVSLLGIWWTPLLLAIPALILAAAPAITQAIVAAFRATFPEPRPGYRPHLWRRRALTAWLHLIQPAARLWGRLGRGLTPWRRRGARGWTLPVPRRLNLWTDKWVDPHERVRLLETELRQRAAAVRRGGDFDRWDLEARSGMLGAARVEVVTEEHGRGHQLVRVRAWPRLSPRVVVLLAVLGATAGVDLWIEVFIGAIACAGAAVLLLFYVFHECAVALAAALGAAKAIDRPAQSKTVAARSFIPTLQSSLPETEDDPGIGVAGH